MRVKRQNCIPHFLQKNIAETAWCRGVPRSSATTGILCGEEDRFSVSGDSRTAQVNMQRAEFVDARVQWRLRRVSEMRLNASQQFDHFEWLGNVIIGTDLKSQYLIHGFAARGQHDDRRHQPSLAKVATNVETFLRGSITSNRIKSNLP